MRRICALLAAAATADRAAAVRTYAVEFAPAALEVGNVVRSRYPVAFHWQCYRECRGSGRPLNAPLDWFPADCEGYCRHVVRVATVDAFARCDTRGEALLAATDGMHFLATVAAPAAPEYYVSSNRTECLAGLKVAVLPVAAAPQEARPLALGGRVVDVVSAAGDAFYRRLEESFAVREGSRDAFAWVADPASRWLADCLDAGAALAACDGLARALASRDPTFREAAERVAPARRRLASMDMTSVVSAARAERIEMSFRFKWCPHVRYGPACAEPTTSKPERVGGYSMQPDVAALSPAAQGALRGWLADDYAAMEELENSGKLVRDHSVSEANKLNFLHIPKTGGYKLENVAKANSFQCGVWGSRMIAYDERIWGMYWAHRSYLSGAGKGAPALAREPTKGNHEIGIRTAEWHLPPDLLDATRREQMYPHAQTFCVAREPLQRLGSFVGYNLGEQAQDADAMNAWLESEFDKFEAGQHPNTGHMLPQVHFARWCDVILRYETLRLDLNALAERVDCPIRLKPGELSYEKPTHKGSPTYHGYVAGTISRANRERAAELYKADYALYKRLAAMDRADLVAGGLARGKDGPPYFSLDAQELVG